MVRLLGFVAAWKCWVIVESNLLTQNESMRRAYDGLSEIPLRLVHFLYVVPGENIRMSPTVIPCAVRDVLCFSK